MSPGLLVFWVEVRARSTSLPLGWNKKLLQFGYGPEISLVFTYIVEETPNLFFQTFIMLLPFLSPPFLEVPYR